MVSDQRKKQISLLAENLHHKIMEDNFDNENLAVYLQSYNIGVSQVDMSQTDIDAYVTYNLNEKRPNIFVDSSETLQRQVFSMSHELGHLVLDWNFKLEEDNSENFNNLSPLNENERFITMNYRKQSEYTEEQKESEFEANYFAGCFLIPDEDGIEFVEKYAPLSSSLADLINKVSTFFFVSEQTARIRIKKISESVTLIYGNI